MIGFKLFPDCIIEVRYFDACAKAAGILSGYTDGVKDPDTVLERWRKLEKNYARRGFRTVDPLALDNLEAASFHENDPDLSALFGHKREPGETPILYAARHMTTRRSGALRPVPDLSDELTFVTQ